MLGWACSAWLFMRRLETDGGGYVIGCSVVVLFVLLAAAGLGVGVWKLLTWAQGYGVQPADVVIGVVLLVAIYSLTQAHKNRR